MIQQMIERGDSASDERAYAGPKVVITRVLRAPLETVWKAWTRPEHLARWFGPKGCKTVGAFDVRVGGVWRSDIESPSGEHFVHSGVYRVVEPMTRLVTTHVWDRPCGSDGEAATRETLITVEFEPMGSQTRVTLTHAGLSSEKSCESHRGGWSETLDHLEAFMAGG